MLLRSRVPISNDFGAYRIYRLTASVAGRNRSIASADPVPERDHSLDDLDPLKADLDRDIF